MLMIRNCVVLLKDSEFVEQNPMTERLFSDDTMMS